MGQKQKNHADGPVERLLAGLPLSPENKREIRRRYKAGELSSEAKAAWDVYLMHDPIEPPSGPVIAPPVYPPQGPVVAPQRPSMAALQALLAQLEEWHLAAYATQEAKSAAPDTLDDLLKGLVPGDVVVLEPGDYASNSVMPKTVAGTEAEPIVILGKPGVVITGLVHVDRANVYAYGLVPSGKGRVRAGGLALQIPQDLQ